MRTERAVSTTVKRIAFDGLFAALALVLGYLEHLIPILPAVPGIKPGLANALLLLLIINGRIADAAAINSARIVVTVFTFGNPVSAVYSVFGSALSFTLMIVMTKATRLSPISISACAGVVHNVGQLLAARILLGTPSVISYLPYLIIAGTLCGTLTGIITALSDGKIKKSVSRPFSVKND